MADESTVKVDLKTMEAVYAQMPPDGNFGVFHGEARYMYMQTSLYRRLMIGESLRTEEEQMNWMTGNMGKLEREASIAKINARHCLNNHWKRNACRLLALIPTSIRTGRRPLLRDGDFAITKRIGQYLGGMMALEDARDLERLFDFP